MATMSISPMMSGALACNAIDTDEDQAVSNLRKAVIAMNTGSYTSSRTQSPRVSSIKVPQVTDSGYASNLVSQEPSLASPPGVAAQPLHIEGVAVGSKLPFLSKKIKLQLFEEIPVPKQTRDRFNNLKEQYNDPLFAFIRNRPKPPRRFKIAMTLDAKPKPPERIKISMAVEVLGENRRAAIPWVLIQCRKGIAKRVREFFKQDHVEADFKPREPSTNAPFFPILVYEEPPVKVARLQGLRRQSSADSLAAAPQVLIQRDFSGGTLCGSKIETTVTGTRRFATIGGIIKVPGFEMESCMFALTAGHFVDPNQDDEPDYDEDSDDDASKESYDPDEDELRYEKDSIGNTSFNEEDYELDLDCTPYKTLIRNSTIDGKQTENKQTEIQDSSASSWQPLGHILKNLARIYLLAEILTGHWSPLTMLSFTYLI